MKKILLHSGWQTTNIGDIGHTPGTLRFIEQHIPEAAVSVLLHGWSDSVLKMLRTRFPSVTFIPRRGEEYDIMPEHITAFTEADMVIQNSGMLYNRFFQPDLKLMQMCVAVQKPFGLYGQSFDGFSEDRKDEIIELLNKAAFIYCRDSRSLEYLKGCNVRPGRLAFGPDGCFGTDLEDKSGAKQLLDHLNLSTGQFLTVTLRTNSPNKGKAANVLNPEHLTSELAEENERWAERLRSVITGWIRNTGMPVLLAPEVEKELGHAQSYLYEKLPAEIQSKVVAPSHFWDLDTAASVYAEAIAMVAMEPHSCILGIAHNTPSIHYYSPKHGSKAEMFADIGLPQWLLDIDFTSPDAVLKALININENPGEARQTAQDAMQKVEKITAENMQTVRKALGLN